MITQNQIQQVSDEIARRFQPERIILFGSYAYGTPTEDSDIDLLVVISFEGKSVRKSIEIEAEVHQGFPMDLIAMTPKHLMERLSGEDYFLREVVENGKVLYEANYARVD